MSNWRVTRDYRIWRVGIIRRDKVCQVCGSSQQRQAHHINSGSYFPDERFDLNNGVTLCRGCHTQFHCNYKRSFREKCTYYDWCNFKALVAYLGNLPTNLNLR